jgi:Domain of unknown function (DUF4185)
VRQVFTGKGKTEATITRRWGIGWVALVPFLLGAGPPVVKSTAPAPDIDALFERADGWIGADGAYSVALSPKRTLWLFSDTWVGKIQDGRRTDATIVNNSVGVQEGASGRLNYTIARSRDGKPVALFVPSDGRGWFWLQAGVGDGSRLSLFLNQVEKTDDKSVFGFRSVGLWLGTVANAGQPPESWRIEQVKMPNAVFSKDRTLVWGAAVLRVGDDLYVYGTDERRGQGLPKRQMVVARVQAASVNVFTAWRYFRNGSWAEDFRNLSPLAGDIASEYSVTAFGNRYLVVYTERGLSPRIMGRMADHPWGPWSEPTMLYECPEMSRDKKLFCYSAKAHPSLSSGQDLVVSYVVNSFDFWQVAREAKLYWPRFIRVTLAK